MTDVHYCIATRWPRELVHYVQCKTWSGCSSNQSLNDWRTQTLKHAGCVQCFMVVWWNNYNDLPFWRQHHVEGCGAYICNSTQKHWQSSQSANSTKRLMYVWRSPRSRSHTVETPNGCICTLFTLALPVHAMTTGRSAEQGLQKLFEG